MKITACLLMLLFASLLSTAQLRKGRWMVGGTADLAHTSSHYKANDFDEHIKQTEYNFFPGTGYFFMERCVAGLRAKLSNSKTKDRSNSSYFSTLAESTESGAGVGAFVRFYVFKPKNKFNAFAEVAYSYSNVKATSIWRQAGVGFGGFPTSNSYSTKTKYKINDYSLTAGPVLFISPRVSFELSLGYTLGKVTKQDQTIDRIAVGTGFQVFLGK